MSEIVTFASQEKFRESANELYMNHAAILKEAVPEAEIYHVGSTAVEGSLTKGDVDLQIRVDQSSFEEMRDFLERNYDRNEGSSQTAFFGAYEKNDEVLPLGLQLTLKDSDVDNFWKVTQFFKENPDITRSYNELKVQYKGKDMQDYRDEKAVFMRNLLNSTEYKKVSRRLDLFEKVKLVKGEKFVTFEDVNRLEGDEVTEFITAVLSDPALEETKTLNLLINDRYENGVYEFIEQQGFHLHDETAMFTKVLESEVEDESTFQFLPLRDVGRDAFTNVWAETMRDSLNAPSSLTIEEQMRSMAFELGNGYEESCIAVYEEGSPIGVVMPHIEPGTLTEGRLFYFGLIPAQRGKGKSKDIHRGALRILREEFGAYSYIGSTSIQNVPMIKTFLRNGCEELERNRLYRLTRK